MALCAVCKGIPASFFGPVPENFFSPSDRRFHYPHHTPTALRQSAADGCPMCEILVCQLDDDWLPEDVKDHRRFTLKRAIIDSVQAFGLFMGMDDVSHNFFYNMPSSYRDSLPPGLVNDNNDNDVLMRHWVDDCMQNHEKCRVNYPDVCPTRVLDLVRFQSSRDIVLVEPGQAPDESIPYTTLSYCWGPASSGQLTTTSATLAERKERIRYGDLPLTFKHAVNTARKLKIPYLWIDALCIVQDSPSDWEKEAARMASIYAGSICTISAVAADNSHQGFLPETRSATEETSSFTYWYDLAIGAQRTRVFVCEPNTWALRGPLMTRAWTLQERALSNRIIHFSGNEMLWECKTIKGSEDLPWIGYINYDSDPDAKLLYDSVEEASGRSIQSYKLRDRWYGIVQDYSRRKLTYGTDKLVALSGLAHYHGEQRDSQVTTRGHRNKDPDVYAAGLWRADMPSALLWRTNQHAVRVSPYRAPSWSWTFVDGNITYDSQRIESTNEYGGIWLPDEPPKNRKSSDYDYGSFRVLQIETKASIVDPMGAVSAGHLILQGSVASATIDETTSELSQYGIHGGICSFLRDSKSNFIGVLFADVQTEVQPREEIYCISIRDEIEDSAVKMPDELKEAYRRQFGDGHERLRKVMGLGLLMSVEDTEELQFRRLGIVRWMPKEAFAEMETGIIKVV